MRHATLTMPHYVDFALGFVIAQTRITQPFAHRRLNAFENTVTEFARQWRPRLPLVPDREIRMSDETREALLAWIEAKEAGRGHTAQRLAVYAASVTNESVPEGWVRLDPRIPRACSGGLIAVRRTGAMAVVLRRWSVWSMTKTLLFA